VANEAQRALENRPWVSDALSAYEVAVEFVMARPPSVPQHKRMRPAVKPDVDKLVRAINDALTGIMFKDDAQVVSMSVSKEYDDERRPGAYVTISRFPNSQARKPAGRKRPKARAGECLDPFDDPRDD